MNRYAHITPDTGTHELPAIWRGIPRSEIPTQPYPFPWAKPPVATLYEVRCARLRRFARRFARSRFVADIKRGIDRALCVLGGFAFVAAIWLMAHLAAGMEAIATGVVR